MLVKFWSHIKRLIDFYHLTVYTFLIGMFVWRETNHASVYYIYHLPYQKANCQCQFVLCKASFFSCSKCLRVANLTTSIIKVKLSCVHGERRWAAGLMWTGIVWELNIRETALSAALYSSWGYGECKEPLYGCKLNLCFTTFPVSPVFQLASGFINQKHI